MGVHAVSFDLDGNAYLNPPGIMAGNDDASAVAAALGIPLSQVGILLYKDDGAESGPYAGSYETDLVPGISTTDIIVTHQGSSLPAIRHPTYLAVKSGDSYVIHDISTWDGWMPIKVDGFVAFSGKVQGVSHISIYGKVGVPETGHTGLLLGAGIIGMLALKSRIIRDNFQSRNCST